MDKKRLFSIGGFFGVMALSLLLVTQGPSFARGRIIYIFGNFQGPEPEVSIEPNVTTENRNTTLIFLNESEVEIKITFPEGKTCSQVAVAAPDWNMKGPCYITRETIPPGGTASIIFNSNGDYNYEVEYVGKNHKEKAQIRISGPRADHFRRY